MKKSILLTGSRGFIGSNLYNYLISNINYLLFTTSRSVNSDYQFDFSNEIPDFRRSFNIVIHCAGKAHSIPKSKSDFESIYNTNVIGTKNLLDGLKIYKVPDQFVFISSVSVYGLTNGERVNESYPLLAKDSYGKSKIDSEEYVINWCKENAVLCTILRLPLVVGVYPPGNLGAMIKGIKQGFYFNIAGGKTRKSMVLVSDIAKFILKAAEIGGTYNLTDSIHPSFNELSQNIANQLGKSYVPNLPKLVAYILAKVGDIFGTSFPINSEKLSKITSTLTFDDSKAKNAFGWEPMSVIKEFNILADD